MGRSIMALRCFDKAELVEKLTKRGMPFDVKRPPR